MKIMDQYIHNKTETKSPDQGMKTGEKWDEKLRQKHIFIMMEH